MSKDETMRELGCTEAQLDDATELTSKIVKRMITEDGYHRIEMIRDCADATHLPIALRIAIGLLAEREYMEYCAARSLMSMMSSRSKS